ncbi:MAG: hypothetical protein MUF78_00580 [Candidatus Edwardsbacteria bacterium]|jgi:hypothetical protein|nr:hypothetical protein [Candidatus Edwardsbacteria bacterium]
MTILILWFGHDGRTRGIARRLGANPAVAVEQVRPVRDPGIWGHLRHRLFGCDIRLRPLQHDPTAFACVVLCFAVPGGRMPLEVGSFLSRHRADLPQLGLLLLPDHFVSNTSPAIERFEQLAGQRPIALQELPVPELNPDGSGIAARPWLSQCRIDSFLRKLGLAVPDHTSPAKETN